MIDAQNKLIVATIFDSLPSGLILYFSEQDQLQLNATARELLGLLHESEYNSLRHGLPYYLSPLVALLESCERSIARAELAVELPVRASSSILGYNLKILDAEGEGVLKILTFSDITNVLQDQIAMDKIKEELSQSRRLASIGTMIAGVAHELNNPLTGISMSASLIKMSTERLQQLPVCRDEPKVMENITKTLAELKKISRANETAARLVNDLLSYSRPSQLALAVLSLHGVVSDIVNAIRTNPQFSEFSVTVEGETDCKVLCDRIKLEQVFYNLVKNACEASEGKGQVHISYSEVMGADKKLNIVTHIKDNGPGIDKTIMTRIFDPFFTTKGNSGVGLGLSICYRIVEQHGGLLSVDSEKWKGTEFLLSLPVYVQVD